MCQLSFKPKNKNEQKKAMKATVTSGKICFYTFLKQVAMDKDFNVKA